MDNVICTKHYLERFGQRMTRKSKRAHVFAERAFCDGIGLDGIRDKKLRYYIEAKEKHGGALAKIYHGYIYWFVDGKIVTLYQLPRYFRGAM